MTATSFRIGSVLNHSLIFFPLASLDVVGVDIAVGNASVVETSMSTVDINLAVVVSSGRVSTRRGGSDGGLLVFGDSAVVVGAGPGEVLGVKPPAVIEPNLGRGMTTEDKDFIYFFTS